MADLDMLETIVFSRAKGEFSQKIKEKYKDLNFTTQEESKVTPKFPNVYFCLDSGKETGLMLERTVYEEGIFVFRFKVTSNSGEESVKEITKEIKRIMKKMSFRIVGDAVYRNDANTHWSDSRYERQIGRNDIL